MVHGGKYTYYMGSDVQRKALVEIICPEHGAFVQLLSNHLNGAGCPKCAGRGVDWIERFRAIHGDRYDYSKVVFLGYKTKVEISCAVHGAFWQTPDNHYRGSQGCPACGNELIRSQKQLPVAQFISRAAEVHGGRYEYAETQFDNMLTSSVDIRCLEHGWFSQSPVNHLAGKDGCTKCNHMKSAPEEQVADYLEIFTTVERRNRTLIGPKEIDIYLPEKKIAIEFCGMYWHSHGDKDAEKKGKGRHAEKHALCAAEGVRLITIYETEWAERQATVKRMLRNAIGKTKGRLMARKCELRKPTVQEARAFYEKYHPQGGDGTGAHYGLYWDGKLVACMRFTFGSNDRGHGAKVRQWTLSRYASRLSVAGAASRLFKAFLTDQKPDEVKSFSDNRLFSGGMYEQLGFQLEADVVPDYQVWSQKLGLRPKPHYQRRLLPARLREHGMDEKFDPATDKRTEAEMTYLLGARRIYDCGKKRWLWQRREK
jgi:G:T-mismatch repair DNA endonuclease (very short patch repair protein)